MRPEELESAITELRKEFGGLLDDETLRRIAFEERGFTMPAPKKNVAELKDREEITIELEVTKIADIKEFEKRTGGRGRVRNLNVRDETGNCRLALWDDDVDLVEKMEIQVGTKLSCSDCFVKKTDFGTDVTKGKNGKIDKI
jgi:replication factor A1